MARECKYTLPLWLIALAVGLVPFPQRRLFCFRELWLGLAAACAIAAPSVIWQALHGFPFAELVRDAGQKDLIVVPAAFILNQVVVFDPLFAPLWFYGMVAPFFMRGLRGAGFLSLAFVFAAAVVIGEHGKDYYLAGVYPSMFANGSIAIERMLRAPVVRVVLCCRCGGRRADRCSARITDSRAGGGVVVPARDASRA